MEVSESNAKEFWRARGVPEGALDDLWDLSASARNGDAKTEEFSGEHGEGIVKLLKDLGWSDKAVLYMAEQRVKPLAKRVTDEALIEHTYRWAIFKESDVLVSEYASLGLEVEWKLDPPAKIKLFFPFSEFKFPLKMLAKTGVFGLAPEGKLVGNLAEIIQISAPDDDEVIAITLTALGEDLEI